MLTERRQFIAFGNFAEISIANISPLNEVVKTYNLSVMALPDVIEPSITANGIQQFTIPAQPVGLRPAFQSEDKQTTIFLGTSKVYIEQVDKSVDSFPDFIKMSVNLITDIINRYSVTINRVAINGQLSGYAQEARDKLYVKFFNKTALYGDVSDEWQFRINTKVNVEELNCEINKIVSFNRGEFIINNRIVPDMLFSVYDFNTKRGIDKLFNLEDINKFIELGNVFRETIVNFV